MDTESMIVPVALLVQFGGIVWAASKVSSSVEALNRTVNRLETAVHHLDERLHDHEVRVTVLERQGGVSRTLGRGRGGE